MMKLHANAGVKKKKKEKRKKKVHSTVRQLIHLKITLKMGERAVGQKDREHDIL